MKENVKRYNVLARLYIIFSFLPVLMVVDQSSSIDYPAAIIILVLSQIVLTLFGTDSQIFYNFEGYCNYHYRLKNFEVDPREIKNSNLMSCLFTLLTYLIPLYCSIRLIDVYQGEEIRLGLIASVLEFAYIFAIMSAYVLRMSKLIKYMDKTYEKDITWTQARWDLRKLILDLTLNNHSLTFTIGAFKDSTFMEFKRLIEEKVEKLAIYKKLDSNEKLILKKFAVEKVIAFNVIRSVDVYVENGD